MKYGMEAVYTVPVNGTGAPLPEGPGELRRRARQESGDLDEGEHGGEDDGVEVHPSRQQEGKEGQIRFEEEAREEDDDWVPGGAGDHTSRGE